MLVGHEPALIDGVGLAKPQRCSSSEQTGCSGVLTGSNGGVLLRIEVEEEALITNRELKGCGVGLPDTAAEVVAVDAGVR